MSGFSSKHHCVSVIFKNEVHCFFLTCALIVSINLFLACNCVGGFTVLNFGCLAPKLFSVAACLSCIWTAEGCAASCRDHLLPVNLDDERRRRRRHVSARAVRWPFLFTLVALLCRQAPAAGPQGEQDGTGNWRGMLRKGEEANGSRPGSPFQGAVNLLDVVTDPQAHRPAPFCRSQDQCSGQLIITLSLPAPSLCRLPGSCRHVSSGTVMSSSASSSLTSSSSVRTSRTGEHQAPLKGRGLGDVKV